MATAPHRYTEAILLSHRSEAMEHRFKFIAWLEPDVKQTVKWVHSDNAKDFLVIRYKWESM